MEYFVVCVVALLASGLTFFSGFGLGTILMPVLAIFFPVPIAVLVDTARLLVYGLGYFTAQDATVSGMKWLILAATISAFVGALLGRELLKKITLRTVQVVVGVMLILLGFALSFGLI